MNVKPNPSRDRKGAFAGHAFSQRSLTGALWARLCLEYGVRQDFLDWRVFT